MPKKTKTVTSTVTNTQIMLATAAAFLANGLALAAIPVANRTQPQPTKAACVAQITAKSRSCNLRNHVTGYRSFVYQCPNGKTFRVNTSCLTPASLQKIANENCFKRKYCVVPPGVVLPPPVENGYGYGYGYGYADNYNNDVVPAPQDNMIKSFSMYSPGRDINQNFSDIAFIGRPDENVTFYQTQKGEVKMKIRYTNRGPAALPNTADVVGGTQISVTFLNEKQDVVFMDITPLAQPLSALQPGESFEQEFALGDIFVKAISAGDIKFVKVDLRVGNREVGGQGTFDQDIFNNTVIIGVPITFPILP